LRRIPRKQIRYGDNDEQDIVSFFWSFTETRV